MMNTRRNAYQAGLWIRNPCVLRTVVTAPLLVALFGCETMPTLVQAKPTEQVVSELGREGETGKVTVITHDKRLPRSTVKMRAPHSVVPHAKTERYLKDLLQELIAHVPSNLEKDIDVDVFLTSHTAKAHFFATGENDILVGYESLDYMKNRDQLAFAMAHELAHILLGHNEGKEAIFSFDNVFKFVDKGVMMARDYQAMATGQVDGLPPLTPEKRRKLEKSISEIRASAYGIRSAVSSVLFGAWSRRQERAADRLGYDLLIAAGYNSQAPGELLGRFAKEEDRLSKIVAAHIDTMESAIINMLEITDENPLTLSAKKVGVESLAKGAKVVLNHFDDTHKEAEERKLELYEDYVWELDLEPEDNPVMRDDNYKQSLNRIAFTSLKRKLDEVKAARESLAPDKKPRASTSIVSGLGNTIGYNRYTLFEIRKKQNNQSAAVLNLKKAWKNRPGDLGTSTAYAAYHASTGRLEEALKIVDFLEETYAADAPLYDVRAEVYKSAGDIEQAKKLWHQCDGNEKSYIRHRCEANMREFEIANAKPEKQASDSSPIASGDSDTESGGGLFDRLNKLMAPAAGNEKSPPRPQHLMK